MGRGTITLSGSVGTSGILPPGFNNEKEFVNHLREVACKLNERCASRTRSNGTLDAYLGYSVDEPLLDGAIAAPFQSYGEVSLYQSPYDVAAALLLGIAKNHPFGDGNKRTALQLSVTYLHLHSIKPIPPSDFAAVKLVVECVESTSSRECLIAYISQTFKEWTPPDNVALEHRNHHNIATASQRDD